MAIQIKRGNKSDLQENNIQPGEQIVTLDTDEVGVRSGDGMLYYATAGRGPNRAILASEKGIASGVPTLNASGKVVQDPETSYLPLPAADDGTTDQHWEKYADGRLIQWGYVGGCHADVTSAYGSVWWKQGYTHALPSAAPAFVGNRYAHVEISSSGLLTAFNTVVASDNKTVKFDIQSPHTTSGLAFDFAYLIVGRWK